MLELKDVSFRVDDEKDKEKDILEHVSFTEGQGERYPGACKLYPGG